MEAAESAMYTPPVLASYLHKLPHYDLTLTKVASQFAPKSTKYQEALFVMAAIPVLWMLLWIIIYMLYFCIFCLRCRMRTFDGEKIKKPPHAAKRFIFFAAISTLMVLAACLFCNESVNYGFKSAERGFEELEDDMHNIKKQSAILLRDMDILRNTTLANLTAAIHLQNNLDETTRPMLQQHSIDCLTEVSTATVVIKSKLQLPLKYLNISLKNDFSAINELEFYRRICTAAICTYLIITLAFVLCAVGWKRKNFLLVFMVVTIFNVIITWLAVGVYVIINVGTADLCVDPNSYVTNLTSTTQGSTNLLEYYMECSSSKSPFDEAFIPIQRSLGNVWTSLDAITAKLGSQVNDITKHVSSARKDLKRINSQALTLNSMLDCHDSHRSYMDSIDDICVTSLFGEFGALCALFVAGIFLIVLVFCEHKAARFIDVRSSYVEVETEDHFHSRDQGNRSDNPLYYRFSQISTSEPDNTRVVASTSANASAPTRNSPPPAYQKHSEFYSTYGNSGTLDRNTDSNDLNRNSNTFRS